MDYILSLQALRSGGLVDSIGVNTHIAWQSQGSAYANQQSVISDIGYLGITRVRDSIPYNGWTLPEYVKLAQAGIHFDISLSGPTVNIAGDLAQISALAAQIPGSVASVEGPNEFNNTAFFYNGQSSLNSPAWGAGVDQALYAAVKSTTALTGVSVVAASMSNAGASDIVSEGDLSRFVDSSNWHIYYGNGEQPGAGIATHVAQARQTAAGKPVTITETGYYTAVDALDWGGGGVSPHVQAIETINALLDSNADGVQATYLYELMDNAANPASSDLEGSFGLFLADGTPKPAASAIRNLTAILGDSAGDASTFQPGTLNSSVAGLPPTASSMVLQKSDGTFEVVLWNEPVIWDETTKSEVSIPLSTLSVVLGSTYQTINEYDPIAGAGPVATSHDSSQVSLALGKDPIILELKPNPSSGGSGTIVAQPGAVLVGGAGSDTLALEVSEDAYEGDARFTVSLDGMQIGGIQTATAMHSLGGTQDFAILGNFSPGTHTVTVDVLDDPNSGSPALDRNLYVSQASIDGNVIASAALTQQGPGSQSFNFQGQDSLTLGVSEDAYQGDAQYRVLVDGSYVGGTYSATAPQAAGQITTQTITGLWGQGAHTVGIQFVNDAYGGSPAADRNLYIDSVSYDGVQATTGAAEQATNGVATFGIRPANTLRLQLAEDAYQGDAQFTVSVDGKPVDQPTAVTALKSNGASQAFDVGGLAGGLHDIGVSFLNDAYGGSTALDRNLYVTGAELNGTALGSLAWTAALDTDQTAHFSLVVPS